MDKELRKCQLFQMYKQKHINYKQYENPMQYGITKRNYSK